MKFQVVLAVASLFVSTEALKLSKADLPHDADLVEKLDPTDRYVNDLSILQTKEEPGSTLIQEDTMFNLINADPLLRKHQALFQTSSY